MLKKKMDKKNQYHIFFGNLSNKLRVDIISELKKGERSVLDLADILKVEQSKLSHSLAALRCCSIVNVKQVGKKRVYSLNKKTILPILKLIDKHENKYCEECMAIAGKRMKI